MTTVTVHQAKTHLSRLIAEVLAGHEVVIAPRGKEPMVKLVPVTPVAKPKRVSGRLQVPGAAGVLDHGFWDPLPDDALALWNGEGD